MRLVLFFLFTQTLVFSQQITVDTTFVDSIYFDKVVKRLSDQEILIQRKKIYENYTDFNTSSAIQLDYNYTLENTINTYYNYRWLPKVFGLLTYYEPLFENSLAYYKLPSDLKYIAIIESNLNPQANSPVGAGGLWQFMPQTGKQYGLAKNSYINLFYDPYYSTDAACRFFDYLYNLLGDWNLVLSAYNCGGGCVQKAIKKAGTRDYMKVREFLPQETKDYVMRFHAVRYLHYYKNLYYDFDYKLPFSFDQVQEMKVIKGTTFYNFSKSNQLNLQMLYFLNPHIITEIIPANTFVYYL